MIVRLIGNLDLGNQFIRHREHKIKSQRCNPLILVVQEKGVLVIVRFGRNRNIVLKTVNF